MRTAARDNIKTAANRITFAALCMLILFAGISNSGVEISFCIALGAAILDILIVGRRKNIIAYTRLNAPIFLMIAATIASLYHSPDFAKSLRVLFSKTMEYALIFFLMVRSVNSVRRFHIITGVLLGSAALVGSSGIYQQFTGYDFLRHQALSHGARNIPRLTASFHKRSGFAAYITLVLPLCCSLVLSWAAVVQWLRYAAAALAVALTYCLVTTYSRGAWIGAAAGLACVSAGKFIMLYGAGRKTKFLLTILFVTITAAALLPAPVKERALSIVRPAREDRLQIWRAAVGMIKDRPIFGHGAGRFMDVYPDYRIAGRSDVYAHNGYLQMAAEIGLVGLAAFLWMMIEAFCGVIKVVMSNRQLRGQDAAVTGRGQPLPDMGQTLATGSRLNKGLTPYIAGLAGGMIAFLGHSFFDNNLFSLRLVALFWAVLGIAAAGVRTAGGAGVKP